MNRLRQYLAWVALVVLLAVSATWTLRASSDASARMRALPLTGPGYSAQNVALDERELATFGKARVLKRRYVSAAGAFRVFIVDGTADRHAVHDPLYCIRGAGWKIASAETVTLPGGEARRIHARRGEGTGEMIYWFSDSQRRHASAPRYWADATMRRLTLGKSGDEPVLVLLHAEPGTTADWSRVLSEIPELLAL